MLCSNFVLIILCFSATEQLYYAFPTLAKLWPLKCSQSCITCKHNCCLLMVVTFCSMHACLICASLQNPSPYFFFFMFLTLYENRRAAKIQKLTTDKLTWWKVSCQLKRIISGIILNSSWLCITSRPALSQGDCFIGCLCTVHQILSHMIWYASLKTTMCFRNHFRYCTTSSGMHINSFRILICSKAFILRKICV